MLSVLRLRHEPSKRSEMANAHKLWIVGAASGRADFDDGFICQPAHSSRHRLGEHILRRLSPNSPFGDSRKVDRGAKSDASPSRSLPNLTQSNSISAEDLLRANDPHEILPWRLSEQKTKFKQQRPPALEFSGSNCGVSLLNTLIIFLLYTGTASGSTIWKRGQTGAKASLGGMLWIVYRHTRRRLVARTGRALFAVDRTRKTDQDNIGSWVSFPAHLESVV